MSCLENYGSMPMLLLKDMMMKLYWISVASYWRSEIRP